MREIKYRVWHDKMIYEPMVGETGDDFVKINEMFRTGENTEYGCPYLCKRPIWLEFTGLLDSKGKEVFEGDIVYHKGTKSPKEYIFEVKWCNYKWRFVNETGGHPFIQLYNHPENFEIIGNIYENSNLLTNKK